MTTPTTFIVVLDPDAAVLDLAKDIKSAQEIKAIFNVIDKLRQLGPQLVPPHAKSLKGETDLFELRPRQGSSPSRPIFVRVGEYYIIVAIAKDHEKDMDAAVGRAKARAQRYA